MSRRKQRTPRQANQAIADMPSHKLFDDDTVVDESGKEVESAFLSYSVQTARNIARLCNEKNEATIDADNQINSYHTSNRLDDLNGKDYSQRGACYSDVAGRYDKVLPGEFVGKNKKKERKVFKNAKTYTSQEFICQACGLYFLNAGTFRLHCSRFCVVRKHFLDNVETRGLLQNVHRQIKTFETGFSPNYFFKLPCGEDEMTIPNHEALLMEGLSSQQRHSLSPGFDHQPKVKSSFPCDDSGRYYNTKANGKEKCTTMPSKVPLRPSEADFKYSRHTTDTELVNKNLSHCIVCGEVFKNILKLQKHLLSIHNNNFDSNGGSHKDASPSIKQLNTNTTKSRRMSTVERPKLSLLNSLISQAKLQIPGRKNECKGIMSEQSPNFQTAFDNMNGVVKFSTKVSGKPSITTKKHDSDDRRRMSCPVGPSEAIEFDSCDREGDMDIDNHCIQCDIKFNSALNYRAHKKYYCAGRQDKEQDGKNLFHVNNLQQPTSSNKLSLEREWKKLPKRTAEPYESTITRKRSHLSPFQSSHLSSIGGDKQTREQTREDDVVKGVEIEKSGAHSRRISDASNTKKYHCEECKISFTKMDTYIAHKKYYCHTRRKDRLSNRSSEPSAKILRRKSTKGTPDEITRYNDRSNYCSSGIESERCDQKVKYSPCLRSIVFPPDSLQSASRSVHQIFSHSTNIIGNLAVMQPFLTKQYATLRERMLDEGLENPFSPNQVTKYLTKMRKLSADESHLQSGELSNSDCNSSKKSMQRPTRQSCTATICVKKEDEEWEHIDQHFSKNRILFSNQFPSPLDLRPAPNSGDVLLDSKEVVHNTSYSDSKASNADSCVDEKRQGFQTDVLNSIDQANDQRSSIQSRNHTCKNCKSDFNGLSSFIAHKKYYCEVAKTSEATSAKLEIQVKAEKKKECQN